MFKQGSAWCEDTTGCEGLYGEGVGRGGDLSLGLSGHGGVENIGQVMVGCARALVRARRVRACVCLCVSVGGCASVSGDSHLRAARVHVGMVQQLLYAVQPCLQGGDVVDGGQEVGPEQAAPHGGLPAVTGKIGHGVHWVRRSPERPITPSLLPPARLAAPGSPFPTHHPFPSNQPPLPNLGEVQTVKQRAGACAVHSVRQQLQGPHTFKVNGLWRASRGARGKDRQGRAGRHETHGEA